MTDNRPRVLAFGTYNVRKHPRVGILIDGLRRNGCVVDEVNRPLELSTSQRVEILKKPWKLFGFALDILRLWHGLRKDAHAWMAIHGKPDAVLVGYMGHFDVLLARHIFRDVPVILDHLIFAGDTAKDRGASGLKVKLLNVLDRKALNAADLVVLDTHEHEEMLPDGFAEHLGASGRIRRESLVIPVGAPDEWYAAGTQLKSGSRSKDVVFYGLYTPLQGVPVIAQAIKLLADRGETPLVTMIGKGQDYAEVRRILSGVSNVEFLEWVEPEQLPTLVAGHAISLGIFSTTPKGCRVVPNKVYQSMAAGCAVITSDTAPQRRILGNGVVYVKPGDPNDLADAIDRLLSDSDALNLAQQAASDTAVSFTPQEVAKPLAQWVCGRCLPNT